MLKEILKAREARWQKRIELAREYQQLVITITLNIPGPDKTGEIYQGAYQQLLKDFESFLLIKGYDFSWKESIIGADGPEAYLLLTDNQDPIKIKSLTVYFETMHPLGRLADIDLMLPDGYILTRAEIGEEARKCFLCSNPAKLCIRNNTHSPEEIRLEIKGMIENLT